MYAIEYSNYILIINICLLQNSVALVPKLNHIASMQVHYPKNITIEFINSV